MKIKDLYNEQSIAALATAIQSQHPALDQEAFIARIFDDAWADRELKERTRHITTVMHDFLPDEYRAALGILRGALPMLSSLGFAKMVFPDYVEVYGLDDWEASMPALELFTQEISAEFAIRPFIVRYPNRTMECMLQWAHHEHPEVRRLASEGCRPRLPWGIALPAFKADPSPILPILDVLKHDESESVRRSVANNLNDISKDNPDVVLETLQRWLAGAASESVAQLEWIAYQALRTQVKQGDPSALELLGYPSEPDISVDDLRVVPDAIPMGGEVTLSFVVRSLAKEPQNLMIDYTVYLVRANGTLSPKVFKLKKETIDPGQVLYITKKHSFKPVTTRRYYPGVHAIEPKINGKPFERTEFLLD